jgi:thiol:disulfide interchange protein DsbA
LLPVPFRKQRCASGRIALKENPMLQRLFALAIGLLAVSACSAEEQAPAKATQWVAGQHYFAIDPPAPTADPNKVEVVEAFSYACPHCAHFQPSADELKSKLPKGVTFTYLPAVFHESWEPFARAYYTAESLGVLDKTHQATFDALHRDHKQLGDLQSIAQFYYTLGVDPKTFLSTAESFVVNGKLANGQAQMQKYGIDGTPTLIVNGKYRVTGASAGTLAQMVEVTLYLVQKEIAAKHGGK